MVRAGYTVPMQQLLGRFPQLQIIDISESSALLRGEKQQGLNILVVKKGDAVKSRQGRDETP